MAFVGFAAAVGAILYVTLALGPTLPDVDTLPLAEVVGSKGQAAVPFATVPPFVTRAFVAAEDPAFLDDGDIHAGSVLRLLSARLRDPTARLQDAGTLTLRLAGRLLAGNDHRAWPRLTGAVREVMLIVQLGSQLTRDQRLCAYLNEVPLGPALRGVADAATEYFHKPPTDLTVAEAATLAVAAHGPAHLPPASTSDAARAQRRLVVDRLLAAGVISAEQRDRAERELGTVSIADGGTSPRESPTPRAPRPPAPRRRSGESRRN